MTYHFRITSKQPQKVSFDGVLLCGNVVVDEAMLTGESVPTLKNPLPFEWSVGWYGTCLGLYKNRFEHHFHEQSYEDFKHFLRLKICLRSPQTSMFYLNFNS
jgi:magnesium-transporting ATPase (P-type)